MLVIDILVFVPQYRLMENRNTDFSKILNKTHENKWVAISEDGTKVIAVDENLPDLQKKVGDTQVFYMKVLPADVSFAF